MKSFPKSSSDSLSALSYVTGVSLSADGKYSKKDGTIEIPAIALVCSGDHQVNTDE